MANEVVIEHSHASYVDIPAILGGAVLAIAISLVLVNFGAAVGLSAPGDYQPEGERAWVSIIAVGLWGIWIQMLASMSGGYFAGRMRRPVVGGVHHEREMRDGAHGLIVWAVSTVAVAIALGFTAALMALVNEPVVPVADKTEEALRLEHNAAIILAFITASTCLIAGVAAWWAASRGGEHRDEAIDHSHYISFKKK